MADDAVDEVKRAFAQAGVEAAAADLARVAAMAAARRRPPDPKLTTEPQTTQSVERWRKA
jgi:hypothetical protein